MRWKTYGAAVLVTGLAVSQGVAPAEVEARADRSHIVYGYMQSESPIAQYRWHALTHIGYLFTDFDATGNVTNPGTFTGRSAELKPGGAAANNGVRVDMVLRNGGFNATTFQTVMVDAARRQTLISDVVALVADPSTGCDGVNLDFEPFNWSSAANAADIRAGLTFFLQDLNRELKNLTPPRQLSMYIAATYNGGLYNEADVLNAVDFLIYSGYDFASGSAMTAIGRYGPSTSASIIKNCNDWFNAGFTPGKMVLALPLYGRRWEASGSVTYGASGANEVSQSWTSTNFNSMYASPLFAENASTPVDHYARWYSANVGGVDTVTTYEDEYTLDIKMRLAKAWKGSNSTGKQLAGVGFWSLYWLAQGLSPNGYDPNTGTVSTSNRRMVSQPWTQWEEMFAPPGTRTFRAETFEAQTINPRWADPNEGPDDQNATSTSTVTMAAAPTGAPAGSQRVAQLTYSFSNTPNRLLFKHKVYGGETAPHPMDWNTVLCLVDSTTKFLADLHVPSASPNATLRMVVRDGLNQLEKSPPFSIAAAGWQRIEWDLTSAASVFPYSTSEGGFLDGDGILQTAGGGKRDIAFVGFEISKAVAGSSDGIVRIDQILYTHANPGGAAYTINEFRYADTGQQFVEIYGPAGPVPSGLSLRIIAGASGATSGTVNLGPVSIPNDMGTGFGFHVVGTSSVPNVDTVVPAASLGLGAPDALQLYDSASGTIYDSVVYEGFGGVGQLDGPDDPIVTEHGPGYLGGIGSGGNAVGADHSAGRFPNGAQAFINAEDFSLMPATPGQSNGNSISLPAAYTFSSTAGAPESAAFKTYQNFSVQVPPAAVGEAGGNGGSAHRSVDTGGGGVFTQFGDAALGAGGAGYNVSGHVFVPSAQTVHALGLGICTAMGTNFFASTNQEQHGYESGYWLIYESANGVGLSDGRPDHGGIFEFVQASHDGQDTAPVALLGAPKSLADVGLSIPEGAAGVWSTFRLSVNPAAPAGHQLLAMVNGVEVYRGSLPSGGRTHGAFQVGFRENHAGAPTANEGTWIDNLLLDMDTVPVTTSEILIE